MARGEGPRGPLLFTRRNCCLNWGDARSSSVPTRSAHGWHRRLRIGWYHTRAQRKLDVIHPLFHVACHRPGRDLMKDVQHAGVLHQNVRRESLDTGLPLSVVKYTVRTQNVVSSDAADYSFFQTDPYISSQQPKSVLCIPIKHIGKLIGVLYLENNLTTGAFTPDRLQLLNIISTQAAISIENARLFKRLECSEGEIKASLKEKEILLQEIHHRVKNNLTVISSLLRLQAGSMEDERLKEALKESQNRIYAISAVHETLHGSEKLSEIDLKSYLSKITASIFETYSVNPTKITLKNEIENSPIAINQAYPIGLVINELMSNSLKYAFPDERKGEIKVSLNKLDDQLQLIVLDDGIGMPDILDWKNANSLGLKLVRTLVENQLDGSIDMESSNGTKFTIKFNIEA